jgi:hypothetical protein
MWTKIENQVVDLVVDRICYEMSKADNEQKNV